MTVNFPNESRGYDPKRNCVRFWGYDTALEIPFFVEVAALCKLNPRTPQAEAGYLATFDAAREQIEHAARRVYRRGQRGFYQLAADDF